MPSDRREPVEPTLEILSDNEVILTWRPAKAPEVEATEDERGAA